METFFTGKTSDFWHVLSILNGCWVHLLSTIFCLPWMAHVWVITCFRSSPKKPLRVYTFKAKRIGRTRHVPDSSNHSLHNKMASLGCGAMCCDVLWCGVMWCNVVPCGVMSGDVMWCDVPCWCIVGLACCVWLCVVYGVCCMCVALCYI